MKSKFPWQQSRSNIPKGLLLGHDEVRAELVRATEMQGRVGDAAAEVARLCLPHFEHEEKSLFPILSILPEMAAGIVRPEMAEILPMVSAFKAWHETADEQHQSIANAIHGMLVAAYREDNREIIEFGYCLRVHERLEDDVIYPTALMIGNYVQDRLGA
jgi:hypothetical protein